jgi:hypothetical protein
MGRAVSKHLKLVGFEVLAAVSTKMAVFWFVASCSLVEVYPEDSHLHLKLGSQSGRAAFCYQGGIESKMAAALIGCSRC